VSASAVVEHEVCGRCGRCLGIGEGKPRRRVETDSQSAEAWLRTPPRR
jgi:hypothetical protein